ncbi:MAG: hypothetical protein EBT77_05975 [Verrucomicrobia bacterium]|nr:hypothetical protein [Verrucomicrobiota bacterium]
MLTHHRDTRLRRRQEAEEFRRIFQPLSIFFGALGLLLFLWTVMGVAEGQSLRRDLAGAGVTLMAIPVAVLVFRWSRGHFRKDLHR